MIAERGKSVLFDEVIDNILEQENGWYLCGDRYDSIVEVERHDKGFTVLSQNVYQAGFNNEGVMIWFTRDVD